MKTEPEECEKCGGRFLTKTTRTVKLPHGKMEIKIEYCPDQEGCGYCFLDEKWLYFREDQL